MKKVFKILVISLCLIAVFAFSASAAVPYETYTYSQAGNIQISPTAYRPLDKITAFGKDADGMDIVLNQPGDILFDEFHNYIIIADTSNNRIVITDENFQCVKIISEFGSNGNRETFNSPNGVFVTGDGRLYVADTKNSRIVVFDKDFKFSRILPPISAEVLPEGFSYSPKSVVVDNADNVYVVSMNSNMGVVSLDPNGKFEGFFGAQEVTVNPLEMLYRAIMSEEQLQRSEAYVSVEYSNLTIDKKGFVYVTCADVDRYQLFSAVSSRSKSSAYAPIKKLNPAGTDVLVRNGFFPPVGDTSFSAYSQKGSGGPSEIHDVELMANNMYCLMDVNHNKIFVYDSDGNLLYAFGGKGEAIGLYHSLTAITWHNNKFYNLDSNDGSVTILERTDYGALIDQVIEYQETLQYDKADDLWNTIISKNNNCDMAYLGLGKIALEKGEYKEAMDLFKLIGDKEYYQRAFKLYRDESLSKIGIVVFVVIVLVIVLVTFLVKKVSAYNEKITEHPFSGKFKDAVIYGFYVVRHPFNGYWGLKAEKRGTVAAATFWLGLASVSAIFAELGACYVQKAAHPSVINALGNTLFPLLLAMVANVCFTTLMDGKGTFREVYMAIGYATVPYAVCTIPFTLISYVLTDQELGILSMCTGVVLALVLLLVFCGLMSVHDYSFGKNVIVCLLTVVGIAFILFILIIFISLGSKVVALLSSIISEISYRS